jgi:hypothetical protein
LDIRLLEQESGVGKASAARHFHGSLKLIAGKTMLEKHEREQYFWTEATIHHIADIAARFEHPGCLCAPMVGKELAQRRVKATILDIDERFAGEVGFRRFDLYRPDWLGQKLGVIVCDPPFWIVSLSQLFSTIRLLSQHDYGQPLAICYPQRRSANLMATFSRFGLEPTGYMPRYCTVQDSERNQIEFFANFQWD